MTFVIKLKVLRFYFDWNHFATPLSRSYLILPALTPRISVDLETVIKTLRHSIIKVIMQISCKKEISNLKRSTWLSTDANVR